MQVGYKVHCTSEPNRQLQQRGRAIVTHTGLFLPVHTVAPTRLFAVTLHNHTCVCVRVEDYVSDLWPFKLVNSAVNERASITFDSKLTWIVKRSNGLPQMSFNACGHIDDFRQRAPSWLGGELFININLIFSSMVSIEISFDRNNFTEILLKLIWNQFIISF